MRGKSPIFDKQYPLATTEKAVKKYVEIEKTRDRQSTKIVEVYEVPKKIDAKWKSAGCVIKVLQSSTRKNEPCNSKSYYLCSLSPHSRRLAEGIRGHWLIENRLPYRERRNL